MAEIGPLYSCKRAVLQIHSDSGHVALWKNPDSFFPEKQIELLSVLIEHYPQDHLIGIYGNRTKYLHKSEIEKDLSEALFDQICSHYVETEMTQNIIRWALRKPPRPRKCLADLPGNGGWYRVKEYRDFRLLIREGMLSIFEGVTPSNGNFNK